MKLSAEQVRTLRALGWSVRLPLARRPTAVPVDDVLLIGEDVMIDERTDVLRLVDLDGGR